MTNSKLIHKTVKLGQNTFLASDTKIGKNTIVGNNVTFYEGVTVGDNVHIFDGAVIGRPPKATSVINRKPDTSKTKLTIGEGSIIGANAVLYTNIKIGKNVLIGDLATIREGCQMDDGAIIGRGVLVMYDTKVGARTRIIDGCILTGEMIIEEDVFFGPGVNSINDRSPYLARFGLGDHHVKGPTVRKYALVGAGANLNADIEVGMGAIVAPNAMVTKDVPAWTVVAGVPARFVRKVDPKEVKILKKHFKIR